MQDANRGATDCIQMSILLSHVFSQILFSIMSI